MLTIILTALFITGIVGCFVFGLFMIIATIEFLTSDRMNYWRWLIALMFWLTIGAGGFTAYFYLKPPPL
jgi:hypothetical protein